MSRWVEGEVVKWHQWTEDLYSLFIKAPVDPFVAGQFTQIGLGEEAKPLFRPYSFVNTTEDEYLEFYFNHVKDGNLTPQLMDLKVGDAIWVSKKPTGRFTIENLEPAKTLICLATGTGLGVFLSLLKTAKPWEMFERVILVHSVPQAKFLTHHDVIQSFKEQHSDQFTFVPVVTREAHSEAYDKRVTELVAQEILEKDLGLSINKDDTQVMLCGNANMINEMRAILAQREMTMRLPKRGGQVTIESYFKP
tara:strand:- start:98506 stop:99255 length:750 start_codon:yes stop_codon:yes gene_type:complete